MLALHYLFEIGDNSEENKESKSKSNGVLGWLTSKQKKAPKYRYKKIAINNDGSTFGSSSRITKLLTPAAAIAASLYL